MNIIFFLVPLSLIFLGFAVWAFFWAIKQKQFDDLDSPPYQILFEDQENRPNTHE